MMPPHQRTSHLLFSSPNSCSPIRLALPRSRVYPPPCSLFIFRHPSQVSCFRGLSASPVSTDHTHLPRLSLPGDQAPAALSVRTRAPLSAHPFLPSYRHTVPYLELISPPYSGTARRNAVTTRPSLPVATQFYLTPMPPERLKRYARGQPSWSPILGLNPHHPGLVCCLHCQDKGRLQRNHGQLRRSSARACWLSVDLSTARTEARAEQIIADRFHPAPRHLQRSPSGESVRSHQD
ncbi:unnamed protein product [Pleuronectes platessa]|uniref:Uncharacterized protein n=1 Tax=Pleuronectes platessa TaxID=8262 RepID=A0A9N7Z771_PLEPL|nr:unnamed protein product [Pleuronectes platessa]